MAQNDSGVDVIGMSFNVFAVVNVSASVSSILMNLFFVFCMILPHQESEQLKQPLSILLGSLVGCSIAVHACVLVFVHNGFISFASDSSQFMFYHLIQELMLFTMRTSVTSHIWLNVYYYCQIVPAQCSFFIWLKRNIRVFVYSALVTEKLFFLSGFISNILYYSEVLQCCYSTNDTNSSLTGTQHNATDTKLLVLSNIFNVQYWLRLAYFLLSLCVMSASSGVTVLYLWRHMMNMEESSSSFSSPRLHRHMRVTITGIIHAVLYIICSTWLICDGPLRIQLPSHFDPERNIYCTVISLYTFCSTLNLGAGQSIFRQRIVNAWQNLLQIFKYLYE
ncbi:taste receptor type 2 member 10-like [Colossoma macropomum]|uniref:taste receptor type 2 member 10-like n=1 Tax=Colossoma macropomum TaxID=42526 RepID=UPI0018647DC0|nr:taste receptor type 2 member 10-like [Colossoma macropomum]